MDLEVLGIFVGKLMKNGQRNKAEKVLLDCLEELRIKHKVKNPVEVVLIALQKISPLVEIKSKKVGGTVYRIPKSISEKRAVATGISWLLSGIRESRGQKLSSRIAKELLQAYSGEGKAVERVREVHEFAKKNRGLVKFL